MALSNDIFFALVGKIISTMCIVCYIVHLSHKADYDRTRNWFGTGVDGFGLFLYAGEVDFDLVRN